MFRRCRRRRLPPAPPLPDGAGAPSSSGKQREDKVLSRLKVSKPPTSPQPSSTHRHIISEPEVET